MSTPVGGSVDSHGHGLGFHLGSMFLHLLSTAGTIHFYELLEDKRQRNVAL